MQNIISAAISILMSVIFITIAFLLCISTSDQNPLSGELLACPDSLANVQKFVADVRGEGGGNEHFNTRDAPWPFCAACVSPDQPALTRRAQKTSHRRRS